MSRPRSAALLSERRLRRVARRALEAGAARGHLAASLAFCGERLMRRLNRTFAGDDYATDVLSFAALEGPRRIRLTGSAATQLGDVVICLPQAARQARAAGHSLAAEVDLLLAHGMLHLIGFDHDTPARRRAMERAQARALSTPGEPPARG